MKEIIIKKERFLHYTMSFIGGIFAIYALLEHSNIFASAETSNMIILVESLINADVLNILIRTVSLLIYAAGITFAVWMSKKHMQIQKKISIIIDLTAALILGFMPENTHPVIALYPVAFAMSVQWCSFREVEGNVSATTFSTGNFRQLITNIFDYISEHDRKYIPRIGFYGLTMLYFHLGVAVFYIIQPYIPQKNIWLAAIPLTFAFIQEKTISSRKKEQKNPAEQNDTASDDI